MVVTEPVDGLPVVRELAKVGLLLLGLAVSSPAGAAGGSHIVDDSEVETPGDCHVELWLTRFVPGTGYGNAAPACTPKRIPFLEVGMAYQDYWSEEDHAPILGPTVKINLRPQASGLGLAIEGSSGVDVRTSTLNFASALGVVTIPFDNGMRINLNSGWSYVDGDRLHGIVYGGQIEADIGRNVTLMIEAFGRTPGTGGVQAGLRFTPKDGPLDFDLLAARFLGADQRYFFTVGITVRF
jgi:hypothetical protein